ncbi:Low temperature viability protein [Hypoxylon rubiginosum]|uniref:Low temperature viability protein n=1 Tax=Hypoxylon rubiginosum TaxID=110542 RepID=A0ACB9YWT0_9PEZI|nr:Low temperature viability protein [Hypoxylon rubiginosum]
MPKGKWINKKTAQHFTLVHRPQNDPLIHDTEAPSMILNPTALPNASKIKKLDDLASELGSDAELIRSNEGEAANYGVYFDDTEYDYMQHLRDLNSGNGSGEVVFVEANSGPSNKNKGKQKQSLEDALKRLDVEDDERKRDDLFGDDFLPSKNLQHITYQAQQEIPDAIGGFQPDMDPRLREVLEALEDEAYVDDDDDVFQELAKDGHELDDIDFEAEFDDDEGWESDDTAKPNKEYKQRSSEAPDLVPVVNEQDGEAVKNEDWLEDFKKFKKDQTKAPSKPVAPSQSDLQSSLMTTTTNGGRRKKRKGALTNLSGYSMTSSSLVRTEQLGILDARFDVIDEKYNEDDFEDDDNDDGTTSMSQVSTASSVTGPMRGDFDGIMDDFLGGYSMHGKKHLKKGNWKSGTAQLDEIRRELGPARVRGRYGTQPASASASASR